MKKDVTRKKTKGGTRQFKCICTYIIYQGFTTRSRYTTAQGLPQQPRYTGQCSRMHAYNCFIALLTHNSCPHACMHNSCPHACMHNSVSSRRAGLFQSTVRQHLLYWAHLDVITQPTTGARQQSSGLIGNTII